MKKVLLFLLVLLSVTQLWAQGLNSDGKDFYVGYLYPSYNSNASEASVLGFFGVYVLVSSYYDNVVTVSYFDDKGNENGKQSYKVYARRTVQIPINRALMRMSEPGDQAEFKSMHITSKSPINVQYFSTGSNSGGSYLALPVNALGMKYVVESYHDNPNGVGGILSHENSAGYFMVIAPFDGTSVTITPSSTTQTVPGSHNDHIGALCGPGAEAVLHPFTIQLRRGQCYMLKSLGQDAACDISGTTVVSDKPVAVIAGHENALTDGSNVGSINVEQRDFMIEQMLPVEFWDTTGYVAVPMLDSKGAPGGDGDEIRMFYDGGVSSIVNDSGARIVSHPSNKVYQGGSIPHDTIINGPVHLFSNNGKKFHVAQYDQRMQGAAPFPAPSQMTIIPKSCWKTSYLWYVPNNTFEILQGYYITLICRTVDYANDSILIAVDGGKPAPIKKSGLSQQKQFQIPDLSGYIAVILKLTSASYYATSIARGPDNKFDQPFMIYSYGYRAIDPDRDLGDFDADDHFFSYALPIGMNGSTGDSTHFTVTVDTQCSSWNVCVDVNGANHPGIKSITILDDPNGDYVRPGRTFYNAGFDPAIDPGNLRQLNLSGLDSHKCVVVTIPNLFDSSYAPLYIVDSKGNDYLVELRHKAPQVFEQIDPPQFANITKDSITFPISAIGEQQCATIILINTGKKSSGNPNIDISNVRLTTTSKSFALTDISPKMPAALKPGDGSTAGDTLKIIVCFSAADTLVHTDTLLIETACSTIPITISGQGGTGLITATDVDFGGQVVGSTTCNQKITIRNIGTLPFTLTGDDLPASSSFKIDPSSLARLPVVLYPLNDPAHKNGDTIQLLCCFTPKALGADSVIDNWKTDIEAPFTTQVKSWSSIKGLGIKPGAVWDRDVQRDTIDDPHVVFTRVNLINSSNKTTTVLRVFFSGPDAVEYNIVGNQRGYPVLENFPMAVPDTMWVDYEWRPDVTRPIGRNPRSVNLIATFDNGLGESDSTVIAITDFFKGVFGEVQPSLTSETTVRASITENMLHLAPLDPSPVHSIRLYDVLGRLVNEWRIDKVSVKNDGIDLPIPKLSAGTYIVRVEADGIASVSIPIQLH